MRSSFVRFVEKWERFWPLYWRWRKLEKILASLSRDDFFFIQIGANDGVIRDHLRPSIIRYGWKGILVEPICHYFTRLVSNYKNVQGLIFENCAISKDTGSSIMYLVENQEFPKWAQCLASFQREVIMSHQWVLPHLEKSIKEELVTCLSWKDLLHKHQLARVDLLAIDTEGYDYEIIKQVLDAGLLPTILLYEHKHLSCEDRNHCQMQLQGKGYKTFSRGNDTLAYRC